MSHYESLAAAVEPYSVKYYHGRITREEAERRLRLAQEGSIDGFYLIRDHLYQDGFFALSLFHHGAGITHYVIERDFMDGSVSVSGSSRKFAGPVELVNYYCFHSSGLSCRLQKPCILQRGTTISFFTELSPDKLMQEMTSVAKKYMLSENEIKGCLHSYRRPEFEKLMKKYVYQNRDWFHGVLAKKEVEKRLKVVGCQDGTFLVWIKSNTTTHYLSLCYKGSMAHHKIRMDNILGQVSIEGRHKDSFDSLLALVDYHEKKAGNLAHVLVESCVVDVFGQRSMQKSHLPDTDQLNEVFRTILRIDRDGTESMYQGQSQQPHAPPKDKQEVDSGRLSNYEENRRPSLSSAYLHGSASSSPVPGSNGSPRAVRGRRDSNSSASKLPPLPARASFSSQTSDYQSTASGDSLSGDFATTNEARPANPDSQYMSMHGSTPWKDKRELMDRWRNVISTSSPVRDSVQQCIKEDMLSYFTRMKIADEEEIRQQYRRGKTVEATELMMEKLSRATDIQFVHDLARALHENDHTDVWQDLKDMLMKTSGTGENVSTITSLVPDYPTVSREETAMQTIHGQIWTDVLKQNMTELRKLPYDDVKTVFTDKIPGFNEMYSQDFQCARNIRDDTRAVEWLFWKLQTSAYQWHNALLEVLRHDRTLSNVVTDCFHELHDRKQCPCRTERPGAKVTFVM